MSDATNPCSGGHVGFGTKVLGAFVCNRCGEILDTTPCIHGLAVAFCSESHDHIQNALLPNQKWKRERMALRYYLATLLGREDRRNPDHTGDSALDAIRLLLDDNEGSSRG